MRGREVAVPSTLLQLRSAAFTLSTFTSSAFTPSSFTPSSFTPSSFTPPVFTLQARRWRWCTGTVTSSVTPPAGAGACPPSIPECRATTPSSGSAWASSGRSTSAAGSATLTPTSRRQCPPSTSRRLPVRRGCRESMTFARACRLRFLCSVSRRSCVRSSLACCRQFAR